MVDYFQILSAIAVVFLALYYYFTSTFDFWKNRGVVGPLPLPIFGNLKDVLQRKMIMGDCVRMLYEEYKSQPMFGIFLRSSPSLVLCDLDLIKDVLIKNFSTFDDRGFSIPEKVRIANFRPLGRAWNFHISINTFFAASIISVVVRNTTARHVYLLSR